MDFAKPIGGYMGFAIRNEHYFLCVVFGAERDRVSEHCDSSEREGKQIEGGEDEERDYAHSTRPPRHPPYHQHNEGPGCEEGGSQARESQGVW